MAGAPCPVEVMKRCLDELNMSEVSIAYGMTETSPVSCQTLIDDDLERRTATSGALIPTSRSRSSTPTPATLVERGQPGEFCTRGYSVMLGYWNDDAKTAEAIDDDGWMHTGDLAVMRDDGYCKIVGRIKDMVIRGGENVYPREIEEFLYTHPDIDDVQVIGVPDPKYGEEICAWIKMRPGGKPLDAAGRPRVRGGKAGALQDSALRPRRRRLPDDRHRQGPQGRDARRNDQDSRPARCGGMKNGCRASLYLCDICVDVGKAGVRSARGGFGRLTRGDARSRVQSDLGRAAGDDDRGVPVLRARTLA